MERDGKIIRFEAGSEEPWLSGEALNGSAPCGPVNGSTHAEPPSSPARRSLWRRRAVRDGDYPGHDPWFELHRELHRSRRYGHHFAVVALPIPPAGRVSEHEIRRFVRGVTPHIRIVDRAWIADDRLYILLPDSDHRMAHGLLDRIEQAAPGLAPLTGVRVVAFPDDATTQGALLSALRAGDEQRGTRRVASPGLASTTMSAAQMLPHHPE